MRNLPNAAPQFSFHWCSLFIHMLQVIIWNTISLHLYAIKNYHKFVLMIFRKTGLSSSSNYWKISMPLILIIHFLLKYFEKMMNIFKKCEHSVLNVLFCGYSATFGNFNWNIDWKLRFTYHFNILVGASFMYNLLIKYCWIWSVLCLMLH